ncbi:MAG: NDP-sugar synthase [Candidatus Aenigmarchaeota archaeon]|nr:NDP-sugar synthase [Candidatus Aenigmarchaeota archaeon]
METPESYFLNSELIVHAGGLSERWWPVTEGEVPKPRTDIGKKPRPMIDWVILPYVVAGIKHIFVSLWHKPDTIVEHLEEIEKNTDIKFTYLVEPEDRRLGRAGVIKYFLENGVLSEEKPKIWMNASDIVRINIRELLKFHLIGLNKGFLATVVGSSSDCSQFGRIRCDPKTKAVKSFEEKPITTLPKGEYVNTGIFCIDQKLNKIFFEIEEKELPIDVERCSILPKICKVMRCFEFAVPFKNWVWLKNPKDYKRVKDMDLEKFLEVPSVEKYLGPYSPLG